MATTNQPERDDPLADAEALNLADLVDVPALQAMMEDFHAMTGFSMALVDLSGAVLIATGWQDICTKFHRVHPDSARHCMESDTRLSSGVEPGQTRLYKCPNHLWDVVTPITVGGRHMGNLFLGQFFFDDEQPDVEVFREQAQRYGFDEQAYLAALNDVPFWSRGDVERVMGFYSKLARLLSEQGYRNLQLAAALRKQRETEQALRTSEALYRSILNASPDNITITDLDGRIQMVSPSAMTMFGYEREADLIGRLALDFILPEEHEQAAAAIARMFQGLLPEPSEYKGIRADGTPFDIEANGEFIRDADGQPARMILIIRDITARKQAGAQLRLHSQLLDSVSESVVATDLDGRILYWGRGAEQMYGYTAGDVMGRPYRDFAGAIDPPDEASFRRTIVEQGSWHGVYLQKDRNGRTFWTSTVISLVTDERGQPSGFIGIDLDISDRKRAEQKLKASEERFQQVAETAKEWIWEMDADGVYTYSNPVVKQILGYAPEELVGQKRFFELFAPQVREKIRQGAAERAARKEAFLRRLVPASHKDGREVILETTGVPVLDADGRLIGYRGTDTDVTERRRAEKALQESEALYRSILNASPDDITITDLAGTIQMVSASARKMFRCERDDQLVGHPIFEFIAAEERDRAEADITRVLQQAGDGPVGYLSDYRGRRRDGSTFDIEVHGEFIRDEAGQPVRMVLIVRDTTERREAEAALLRQQTMLSRTESIAHIGSWELDSATDTVIWSEEMFRIFQRNPSEGAPSFAEHAQFIPPDDFRLMKDAVKEALRDGTSYELELHAIRKDRETRICLVRGFAEQREQGNAIRLYGSLQDITERKQAEEQLKASMEQYRDIAATIPGAIYQIRPNRLGSFDVPYMSGGCETLFERPLVGLNFTALLFQHMHVGDRALFEHSLFTATPRMERWSLDFRIVKPDGQTKWLRGSANPRTLSDGSVAWNGVLLDIDQLKRAEETLRDREAFQSLLMNTMPSPVFYKDRQGRYREFNQAFETFFGKTRKELIGRNIFDIVPPDLAELYHAKDLELIEKAGTQVYESRLRDARGALHDVVFHKAAICDIRGVVTGVIGILHDITARKQTEQELSRQLEELRRWQTATLGREGRIAELKREVNALAVRLGHPPSYPSVESAGDQEAP